MINFKQQVKGVRYNMKLLIYGASGLAKEVYDLIMRSMPNRWEKIYFIDDFKDEEPFYLAERIKFSTVENQFNPNEFEGVVAVGEPMYRELLAGKLCKVGIKLATLIDSTAIVSPNAEIQEGVIVCEKVSIHAGVKISRGVLIQPSAIIGHDIKIGEYSVIGTNCAPGGDTVFGKKVYTGMNSTIKEKLTIGDEAVIGMGAVVYRDVDSGATVVGNPARVTRGNDEHRIFR
jgi:sugar O-acyltransferase (sialic acid O-acetyltransferase NeuD family)